jgi:hypothetical protein
MSAAVHGMAFYSPTLQPLMAAISLASVQRCCFQWSHLGLIFVEWKVEVNDNF